MASSFARLCVTEYIVVHKFNELRIIDRYLILSQIHISFSVEYFVWFCCFFVLLLPNEVIRWAFPFTCNAFKQCKRQVKFAFNYMGYFRMKQVHWILMIEIWMGKEKWDRMSCKRVTTCPEVVTSTTTSKRVRENVEWLNFPLLKRWSLTSSSTWCIK